VTENLTSSAPPAKSRRDSPSSQTGETSCLFITRNGRTKVGKTKLDLILAGHSHGGQVRLPFYGPLILPFGVGAYDLGLFQTSAGPLYVNAGIGYFYANVRFNCRPEITVFEM